MSQTTKQEKTEISTEPAQVQSAIRRSRRSVFEKVSIIGFSLSSFFCGIIALVLVLTGSIVPEILVITVLFLLGALLMATRARRAPLLGSLLGAVLLYLVVTQPYVITSLIHPRDDPLGGFGHYVGVVFLIACVLVALGGSLATALQNYLPGARQTSPWLSWGLSLVIGIMVGALFVGVLAPSAVAPIGLTYTNGVPTVHLNGGAFFPASVALLKGSKLILMDDTSIEHELANGRWLNGNPSIAREPNAPLLNDIKLSGKSITIGPFVVAGTYHILCLIHQRMTLTILVQ